MVGVVAAYLLLLMIVQYVVHRGRSWFIRVTVLRYYYGLTLRLSNLFLCLELRQHQAAFYRNLNCRHINLLLSYGTP